MDGIEIRPLSMADASSLRTVAAWIHGEWSGKTGITIEAEKRFLLDMPRIAPGIPTIYMAFLDGRPVGTGSIWPRDCPDAPDLQPWLAALYVAQEHRRLGVGRALIRHRLDILAGAGYAAAYNWSSEGNLGYHRMFGWEVARKVSEGYVMRHGLGKP